MFTFIRRCLAIFLLAIFSWAANADEFKQPPNGVWKGTLGKQAITLCLPVNDGAFEPSAMYYYDKYGKPLKLIPEGKIRLKQKLLFKETSLDFTDEISGHWELNRASNNQMTGSWSDIQNGKQLPINLGLVTGSTDDSCRNPKFLDGIRFPITSVRLASINGLSYRQIHSASRAQFSDVVGDSFFQLIGTDEITKRINAFLIKETQSSTTGCVGNNDEMYESECSSSVKPSLLTEHWLYANYRVDPGSCGSAQLPTIGGILWNRDTGKK